MTENNKSDEALLSYYTRNAATHASLIVAIVFGLFSVLGIALNVGISRRWLFLLPVYIVLAILGDYEIRRFLYYGDLAKVLADELFENKLKHKEMKPTYLHWAFELIHFVYPIFLLFSFLGVYGLDILRVEIVRGMVNALHQHASITGLLLQILGVVIILISQGVFLVRAQKKLGSLKKVFLSMSFPRVAPDDKKFKKADTKEIKQLLKKFPLARLLWDDFWVSLVGLILTLIGLIIEILGSLSV